MTTSAARSLPDFLIVGAMRSGTTSLYRYLGAHPDVSMAPKELQFFTEHFDRGLAWYQEQLVKAGSTPIVGEATADYLARESAMSRIASVVPAARIIASLRDPVERSWSHYGLMWARGREPRSFAAALTDELAAIDAQGPGASGVVYLSHGLYDEHIERAMRLFDQDQIFVGIFERWVGDPATMYRSMCEFLEIDPTFAPRDLGVSVNAFVTFRSLRARRLSHRMPRPVRRVLARANTRRTPARPALDSETRKRLTEFYAPRVARLEELLGYEIPEWRDRTRRVLKNPQPKRNPQ